MKNKFKKIVKILIALILIIALQIMGFTYAKYITQDKGTGTAEIAKWAFRLEKGENESQTIKLIDTVHTNNIISGKIAPGSGGKLPITIDMTGSEVGVEYEIKFANEKNKPQNLKFTYAGRTYDSLSEITPITGMISHSNENRKLTFNIDWMWNYETGKDEEEINQNDIIDTQDANLITEYTFDIIATGTQSSD